MMNNTPLQQDHHHSASSPCCDLDILAATLAPFLNHHSALACLLVCRAWHRVFEPVLWHDFWCVRDHHRSLSALATNQNPNYSLYCKRATTQQSSQEQHTGIWPRRQPSKDLIQRNARHIRRLYYYGEEALLKMVLPGCIQLQHLEVTRFSDDVKQLLEQNVLTLKSFVCRSDPVYRGTKEDHQQTVIIEMLWHLFVDMPRLKSLTLESVIISDYRGMMFGNVCRKLERLDITDSKLLERPKSESGNFDSIKTLVIDRTYLPNNTQLELFQLCGSTIQHLTWRARPPGTLPMPSFLLCLSSGSCPVLQSLDFSDSSVSDNDFAQMVQLLPMLNRIKACRTVFGIEAARAVLERQSQQMIEIRLSQCTLVTDAIAHELLSNCPRLQVFSAPIVRATDMAQQRWVCRDLRELDISIAGIELLPAAVPRHGAIFTQLAALLQLRILRLGDAGPLFQQPQMSILGLLDLTLESGLGILSTLTYLRSLDIEKVQARMEFEELRWMVQHWRYLERILGSVHPNIEQCELSNEFLCNFLKNLKVFLNSNQELVYSI